ncbi:MAG: RluA family pseudouridine synthase [Proteobacteria bacterium]|nr:RluA family pseudouridine synthase [Pseudomonadota bacterium]
MGQKKFEFRVDGSESGMRVDVFLSLRDVSLSRSQVKRVTDEGFVWVNGSKVKASHKLKEGDTVVFLRQEAKEYDVLPEDIPLNIVYEDKSVLVVDKSAGMVVHPAAGNYQGTLVNALLFHCRDLSGIGGVLRPGIVHRLDKGTSGLMVVTKSDEAHRGLAGQFKDHLVKKIYNVLVYGDVEGEEGVIDLPVGRHPVDRKKMSAESRSGKEAITRWKVVERYGVITLLDAAIETGRTHQIRVHLNASGHPVVGDTVYGSSKRVNSINDNLLRTKVKAMKRQALHSSRIGFFHPISNDYMEFSSPLPDDMDGLCKYLREYTSRKFGE